MDLITLLTNLNNALSALQQQLADAQAAAQAQYDKGFADGKASVTGGFTQADIDAAVKAAVDPLNEQIAAMQSQIDSIPAQIEVARTELKAAVKSLMQAEELDEESKLDNL
jgi:flagellar capping protein FliD